MHVRESERERATASSLNDGSYLWSAMVSLVVFAINNVVFSLCAISLSFFRIKATQHSGEEQSSTERRALLIAKIEASERKEAEPHRRQRVEETY